MALFGKERFPSDYQKKVGMNARELLHRNSKELVQILKDNDLLTEIINVFELGSGPCRNLYYLWLENKKIKLNCSDLFKDASLENMHPDIRDLVNFIEGDSESVICERNISNIDLFIISDHMMHLQKDKADIVINGIVNTWRPKHILLREVKKDFETLEHPRIYQNYDKFLKSYDLLKEYTSVNDSAYFIWLLRLK